MAELVCPDQETLKLLLLGRLQEPEHRRWESHLLACADCAASAETIHAADSLTEAIARRCRPRGDEELVQEVIRRAKSLSTKLDTVHVGETRKDGGIADWSAADSLTGKPIEARLDFLAAAEQPDEIGRLGDYRVLKLLGAGGMGVVLLGEDIQLKRRVALKVMRPGIASKPQAKQRFLREARATAALSHDHIVQIYQVGEARGVPFIAMQYLEGQSLQAVLTRSKRLKPIDVARIGKEVALGLAAAHEKGLIHRDIKPDNIWIESKTRRTKLLDFGLARELGTDHGLTQSGAIIGTPRYMAPEQITGDSVDHRADLFSLGSTLYHLAAGKPAFKGASTPSLLYAIAHSAPQPLQQAAPGIHPSLAELIHSLLSKSPAERPQASETVADRLAEVESELTADSVPSPPEQPPLITPTPRATGRRRPPGRHRLLLVAAGAAAFALMLGVIVITIRRPDGTETTIRVAEGTSTSVRVERDSEIQIQQKSGSLEQTKPLPPADSQSSAETDLKAGMPLDLTPPEPLGTWEMGPEPPWFGAGGHDAGYPILQSDVLPGLIERPALLPGMRRWNVDTRWGRGSTHAARYSPDGKWIAIASTDGHARIYDAASMQLTQLLPGKTVISGIDDLSWHPDSRRLSVAIPNENTSRIWSIDGQLLFEQTGDARCHSVAWSPDGKFLAEAFHARLQLRRPDGSLSKILAEGDGVGPSTGGMLAWSPDGSELVCWQHDGNLTVWDVTEGTSRQFGESPGHRGYPGQRLAMSRNGRLAVAYGDRLLIYDKDYQVFQTIDYRGRGAIAWHPNNDQLFLWDGQLVRCWSVSESRYIQESEDAASGWPHQPLALACSPDGDRLTLAAGIVRVLSSDFEKRYFETPISCRYGTSISWSHDGRYLASTTEGFHPGLPVWDATGKAVTVIPVALESIPLHLSWSPTDLTLVGIAKGQASVISRDMTPATILPGAEDAHSVAWSPDGAQLAFGTGNGTVKIFAQSGEQITEMIAGDQPAFVAWSAANGELWVHCGPRLYRSRPQESWTLIFVEETSEPATTSPSWYPDGELIAVRRTGWFSRDGKRVTGPNRRRPVTWRHDGNAYVAFSSIAIDKHFPGGAPIATRYLNGFFEQQAYRYQPSGNLFAVAFGESVITVLTDEDLQPHWHAVLLPELRSATFSAAGEMIDGVPTIVDPYLVYYFENDDGRIETLTPAEFRTSLKKHAL